MHEVRINACVSAEIKFDQLAEARLAKTDFWMSVSVWGPRFATQNCPRRNRSAVVDQERAFIDPGERCRDLFGGGLIVNFKRVVLVILVTRIEVLVRKRYLEGRDAVPEIGIPAIASRGRVGDWIESSFE